MLSRKRDAVLAASLMGVDTADPDYVPPENPRDDGSDIAGGVGKLSVEEAKDVAAASGKSLDTFDIHDDASVDKLATEIVKKLSTLTVTSPLQAHTQRTHTSFTPPHSTPIHSTPLVLHSLLSSPSSLSTPLPRLRIR